MYNDVDIVWACYPPIKPNDLNLKWASPNRFYQSCFFHKPIITRYGCQDAIDIEHFQIGEIIEDNDVKNVAKEISQIQPTEIEKWNKNM